MPEGKHVLIVDDDPVIRQLATTALTSQGCEVSWADTGDAALAQAMADPPDLILLDVMLPDLNGIEVCRRVRAESVLAMVPVIVITALHDADARLESLEAGADDFLTKPIDFIELRARVGSILRLNRYRRLLDERSQRRRAEEETLKRNRELLLLNAFIVGVGARLRSEGIEAALRDACHLLVTILPVYEIRAWLSPAGYDQPAHNVVVSGGEHHASAQASGVVLTMPLLISGRPDGAITLLATVPAFDSHEKAFVQLLAGALGQFIETSLLHRRLQNHVDSLEGVIALRTNELQAERDRTQAILDALGEAVIVTDGGWRIRYANPATAALTGYGPSELVGRLWSEIQGHGDAAGLYYSIRQHAATGQTWRGEVRGNRHDGSVYDAAMTVAPIIDPQQSSQPIGLVSIQRDITPLKDAERMKDRFISNVSHELRTPLSIIALHSGNLDTLYTRLGDEQRRQLIREVRAQAAILDELIGDVLELSRIDSGGVLLGQRTVDLAELLRREAGLILPLAERKGLRLDVLAPAPLPVSGDEAHLSQCIRNLLSNAIKFTPAGGMIACECRQMEQDGVDPLAWPAYREIDTGMWAGLRVVDSGIGIAAEHMPHLFERFYRVQTQSRLPGTGLGLAITRELVTRYGGWTGVSSLPDAGSTFAFYLPLVAAR